MNNEPVAWMFQGAFDISTYVSFDKPNADIYPNPTPLYTHPVKEHDIGISHAIGFDDGFKAGMQRAVEMNVVKELTDEEIVWLWCDCEKDGTEATYIKFARAILRKAQEK